VIILKLGRLFLGVLLFLVLFSTSYAHEPSAWIKAYPGDEVDIGNYFVIYGYINLYGEKVDLDSFRVDIYNEDGDKIFSFHPELYFTNDHYEGAYIAEALEIVDEGDYDIKLKYDGETIAKENVEARDFNDSLLSFQIKDYDLDDNELTIDFKVKNLDDADHDIRVYFLVGEEEETFTLELNANDYERVEKTIDISSVDGNFILLGYAKAIDESGNEYISNVDYAYVLNYEITYGELEITNIEINDKLFYPGDVVSVSVGIKNSGNEEVPYHFEYVYNNKIFKKGDVSYIRPHSEATETFYIKVPEGDYLTITARIYNQETSDELSETFLISQRVKDFLVSVPNTLELKAGENITLPVLVVNIGNQEDYYNVSLRGWDDYYVNTTLDEDSRLRVGAQESGIFNIILESNGEMRVGGRTLFVNICGLEKCEEEKVEVYVDEEEAEQSIIEWNDNLTTTYFTAVGTEYTYSLNITNFGDDIKNYEIYLESDSLNFSISSKLFALDPDERKEIILSIIPTKEEDSNLTLRVYSNGEIIFEKELTFIYQNTGLTGMFIFESTPWLPGVFILSIIGILYLALTFASKLKKKLWTERVIHYNRGALKK